MAVCIQLLLSPARLAASERISAKVRAELTTFPDEPIDLSALLRDYMKAFDGLMATAVGFYAQRMPLQTLARGACGSCGGYRTTRR